MSGVSRQYNAANAYFFHTALVDLVPDVPIKTNAASAYYERHGSLGFLHLRLRSHDSEFMCIRMIRDFLVHVW